MDNSDGDLGLLLKQKRVSLSLTLGEVATKAGLSPSHLGRIERGERFPSARILRKLAGPLGFEEGELFALAGFLSRDPAEKESDSKTRISGGVDPYVVPPEKVMRSHA